MRTEIHTNPQTVPFLNDSLSDGISDEDAEPESVLHNNMVKFAFIILYTIVFGSCLIGNSMVLFVILRNRSMQTITNFFLANLSVADLFVGVFCVWQNAAHFVLFDHGSWHFGRALCHTYIYFLHMIPNASAGILVLLSIERFIAVLRPMLVHHFMTKSVLVICALLVWALSALMNLPYFIAVQYIELSDPENQQVHGICTRRILHISNVNMLKVTTVVNFLLWYITPLLLLLIIYVSIGFVLMQNKNNYGPSRSSGRMSSRSIGSGDYKRAGGERKRNNRDRTGTPKRNIRKLSETKIEAVDGRRRVIRLVVAIVCAFAFLSIPRYAYLMWSVFRDVNAPRCLNCWSALFQPASFLLMFVNSGLNPILYAFLSQRFRSAISETFTLTRRKKEQRTQILMQSLNEHRRLSEFPLHSNRSVMSTYSTSTILDCYESNGCVVQPADVPPISTGIASQSLLAEENDK